jgi:hypothetical protein
MDETVIENPDVLGALRSREEAKIELSTLRRQYGEAHDKALAEIARLDLADGEVVRIGEFRIERARSGQGAASYVRSRDRPVAVTCRAAGDHLMGDRCPPRGCSCVKSASMT